MLGNHDLVPALSVAVLLRISTAIYVGFEAPPDRDAAGADVFAFEHMAWTFSEGRGVAGQVTNSPYFSLLATPAQGQASRKTVRTKSVRTSC